jgi:hypothetical protein
VHESFVADARVHIQIEHLRLRSYVGLGHCHCLARVLFLGVPGKLHKDEQDEDKSRSKMHVVMIERIPVRSEEVGLNEVERIAIRP